MKKKIVVFALHAIVLTLWAWVAIVADRATPV